MLWARRLEAVCLGFQLNTDYPDIRFCVDLAGRKVWKRDTGTGVSAYRLRRMERQRMTNSDVLLPGTARHTFEGADGMLVMERGLLEWITESLFNGPRTEALQEAESCH